MTFLAWTAGIYIFLWLLIGLIVAAPFFLAAWGLWTLGAVLKRRFRRA